MDELIERIDIGLRIKGGPTRSVSVGGASASEPSQETETGPVPEVLSNEEFLKKLEDRYQKLDPENGLLTLVFIRVDQEDHLMGEDHTGIREKILETIFEILGELCPAGTLLGKLNSFQAGALIPRKNKYGAELILDELSNLLNLRDFHSENDFPRLTLSCGVAEVPSAVIETAKEFEEMANSALHRAKQTGGDRTVLL
jgi:GGDEF domain-containing protein